jgi:hypothetical protein
VSPQETTTSGQAVAAAIAIDALRAAQAAEKAIIDRCDDEIEDVIRDDTLTALDKQQKMLTLHGLQDQARAALYRLRRQEIGIVATSRYAQSAVSELKKATKALKDEVKTKERLAERISRVSGLVDVVADAGTGIVDKVIPVVTGAG